MSARRAVLPFLKQVAGPLLTPLPYTGPPNHLGLLGSSYMLSPDSALEPTEERPQRGGLEIVFMVLKKEKPIWGLNERKHQ